MGKEDKKQRIIDASYKVFANKGYNNASIKDIAKEADVTPGLIHYYFNNKEELLFSVQNYVQEGYHNKYTGEDMNDVSPFDTLHEIKSRSEEDPEWYRMRYELYSLGLKNKDIQKEVASILSNGRESLSKPLQKLSGEEKDIEGIASILLACFDGLALQKMLDKDFNIDKAYEVLGKLVEIYLNE